MPTLREIQYAMHQSLVDSDDHEIASQILTDGIDPSDRLNIYRNTFVSSLTTALRLNYPSIQRIVGAEFFEGAARIFIKESLPQSANLNDYGAEFAGFLARFTPASKLTYLSDVARLEWAISRSLYACDADPLDINCLASLSGNDSEDICFTPHPSIGLVRSESPADTIWHAVMHDDTDALSGVDLNSGPVWLIVQREADGPTVTRLPESAWQFSSDLFSGRPLASALEAAEGIDAANILAEHLAAGRIVEFRLTDKRSISIPRESLS
ncbi:MAG: putative DNA-binding domain-containing protein [Alphaproteobacteria bacterium]